MVDIKTDFSDQRCYITTVANKKRVSVSSSLETTQASTSHNSVSQTLDHILSVQTEFDSTDKFSLHTQNVIKCL